MHTALLVILEIDHSLNLPLLWTPGNDDEDDDDESGVTQVVEADVDQHFKLKVVVTKNCCYLQDTFLKKSSWPVWSADVF